MIDQMFVMWVSFQSRISSWLRLVENSRSFWQMERICSVTHWIFHGSSQPFERLLCDFEWYRHAWDRNWELHDTSFWQYELTDQFSISSSSILVELRNLSEDQARILEFEFLGTGPICDLVSWLDLPEDWSRGRRFCHCARKSMWIATYLLREGNHQDT